MNRHILILLIVSLIGLGGASILRNQENRDQEQTKKIEDLQKRVLELENKK